MRYLRAALLAGLLSAQAFSMAGCTSIAPEFWRQNICLKMYGFWNASQAGVTGIGTLDWQRNSGDCPAGEAEKKVKELETRVATLEEAIRYMIRNWTAKKPEGTGL